MAGVGFSDDLFAEFDRDDAPVDAVLMSKIGKELSPSPRKYKDKQTKDNGVKHEESAAGFSIGSEDSNSDSDCGENENGPEVLSGQPKVNVRSEKDELELSQLRKENILFHKHLNCTNI